MEASTKDLRAAVRSVAGSVARRPGIPALTGVLIEAEHGRARLTTTDLELSAVAELEAGGSELRALVPYRILADALKAEPADRVQLEVVDGSATVGSASIRLLPVEDFPTLDEPTGFLAELDAAELGEHRGHRASTAASTARHRAPRDTEHRASTASTAGTARAPRDTEHRVGGSSSRRALRAKI